MARVYRLRYVPEHADRQATAELLASCLGNITVDQIRIASLANDVTSWAALRTKTATLTLGDRAPSMPATSRPGEWIFPVPWLPKPLILDHHFIGLTPLNEPQSATHQVDCIAISGLGGHPFGSWQPHGGDKSFMWIRDELPQLLPGIRLILYGYDTALLGSTSFQTVPDLANALINTLKTDGWTSPTAKPLLFLAHSLGGVLLKQTLVLLARSGESETHIANLVRGIVFFGVPSQGMAFDDVIAMLGDQPNKDALVADLNLSTQSGFLPQLENQFNGISQLRFIKLYWAYETRTTPTVTATQHGFRRSGPNVVLVTKESATGNRCITAPSTTIQIDETHSDIVKFCQGDHRIPIIANKLREACHTARKRNTVMEDEDEELSTPPTEHLWYRVEHPNSFPSPEIFWDGKRTLESLRFPEQHARLDDIVAHHEHSFQWAYDDDETGLTKWLLDGEGIYWISGKPGSGKSTIMKFLWRHELTMQLLNRFQSRRRLVAASFFFHHRGTAIQKSFEGLLRSIIVQILESQPELLSIVHAALKDMYDQHLETKRLGSLQADTERQLRRQPIKFMKSIPQHMIEGRLVDIDTNQDVLSALRRLTLPSLCHLDNRHEEISEAENDVLRKRDEVISHGGPVKFEFASFSRCKLSRLYTKHTDEDEDENGHEHKDKSEDEEKNERSGEVEFEEDRYSTDIQAWLRDTDLEANLRRLYRPPGPSPARSGRPVDKNAEFEPRNVDEDISFILKRHWARERIRISIQDGDWVSMGLEEMLRRILAQQLFDMDLFLQFDALDEYDGNPEFISAFLHDLSRQTNSPQSRTRIKVLFSSRPWPVFQNRFAGCPGFEIHEHTQEDIRNYCIDSMHEILPNPSLLLFLVDDITERSKGVFLWVKLVLSDLCSILPTHMPNSSAVNMREHLRRALATLPDELEDYYCTIIERIPVGLRWETYVALETLARTRKMLNVNHLVEIMHLSKLRTRPSPGDYAYRMQKGFKPNNREIVLKVSGLLVDIAKQPAPSVQLMHQTVLEFIESPKFCSVLLGPGRATMTHANGHTFLSKFYLLHGIEPRVKDQVMTIKSLNHLVEFCYHARMAESTTGVDQYEYLSHGELKQDDVAMMSGLQLYFENPGFSDDQRAERSVPLFYLIRGIERYGLMPADAVKTIKVLLAKTESLAMDPLSLLAVIDSIHGGKGSDADAHFLELAVLLINQLKDVNLMFISKHRPSEERPLYPEKSWMEGSLLHRCPPAIAEKLLIRGAYVNALSKSHNDSTPLDYILGPDPGGHRWGSAQYLRDLSLLLIRHGGKLNATREAEWDAFLQFLTGEGLDTTAFPPHETLVLRHASLPRRRYQHDGLR